MSFSQFLNWLYGLRDRVTWLIQDAWSSVQNVVSNAFNWAVQQATSALNSAKAYAVSLFNQVTTLAWNLFNQLQTLAYDLYSQARAYARDKRDEAVAYALSLYATLSTYAEFLYNQAVAYAVSLVNQFAATVNGLIEAALDFIEGLLYPLVDWYNAVKASILSLVDWFTHEWPAWRDTIANLVTTFSAANLAKFLDFVNRLYADVVAFFDDPLGVIVAYLEPIVLEWLSELLGYAFKGDGQELPPRTIFRSH